jgi:hypothetical protein
VEVAFGTTETKKSRAKIQLVSELVDELANRQEASDSNHLKPSCFVDWTERRSILIISGARCFIQHWTERVSSAVRALMGFTSFVIQPRAYCTSELMI